MEVFWKITQESRVKLMQLQFERYKTKLDVPAEPEQVINTPDHDEMEKISVAREMSQAPKHPRRVE